MTPLQEPRLIYTSDVGTYLIGALWSWAEIFGIDFGVVRSDKNLHQSCASTRAALSHKLRSRLTACDPSAIFED
jgi:hypothetical protein